MEVKRDSGEAVTVSDPVAVWESVSVSEAVVDWEEVGVSDTGKRKKQKQLYYYNDYCDLKMFMFGWLHCWQKSNSAIFKCQDHPFFIKCFTFQSWARLVSK